MTVVWVIFGLAVAGWAVWVYNRLVRLTPLGPREGFTIVLTFPGGSSPSPTRRNAYGGSSPTTAACSWLLTIFLWRHNAPRHASTAFGSTERFDRHEFVFSASDEQPATP